MEIRAQAAELPTKGVLVVLVGYDRRLSKGAQQLDEASGGLVTRALKAIPGELKNGRVVDLFLPSGLELDRLLLLVAGRPDGLKPQDSVELGAGLLLRLRGLDIKEATIASSDGLELGLPPAELVAQMALGARLRAYRFTKYRAADPEENGSTVQSLRFLAACPELDSVAGLADAVTAARDLVSEPANILHPASFADACRALTEHGLEVEVLDRAALESLGMRALLAVAQGSARPPFVAVMRWQGAGSAPLLALVGKGVCFDSGGISIKPAAGMEEMKTDMAGAAAVFGTMRALAARRAKANVVGVIGLVENMPSGTAQRPGDVVKSMSSKTIEIVNTDAEGRLVLADVLWYTRERFKPAAMVDLATLTGAVIVALGHEQAGLFANDETLAGRLAKAGEATGELVWRLPLGKAYDKHVKSDIADLKNVGRGRAAGSTAGAVFLQQFVGDTPWAHLDIAAMAWSSRDLPLAGKGATGFGVRLLDRLVLDHYSS